MNQRTAESHLAPHLFVQRNQQSNSNDSDDHPRLIVVSGENRVLNMPALAEPCPCSGQVFDGGASNASSVCCEYLAPFLVPMTSLYTGFREKETLLDRLLSLTLARRWSRLRSWSLRLRINFSLRFKIRFNLLIFLDR